MGWNLIDWRPDNINRLNSPEIWDDIYKKKIIPEELKMQLLREQPELKGKDVEFAIYLSRDKCAYLNAFADGLAYRNMGVQWSFVGGAKIEKEISGNRMIYFPVEKNFGSTYPSVDDLIKAAAEKASKAISTSEPKPKDRNR